MTSVEMNETTPSVPKETMDDVLKEKVNDSRLRRRTTTNAPPPPRRIPRTHEVSKEHNKPAGGGVRRRGRSRSTSECSATSAKLPPQRRTGRRRRNSSEASTGSVEPSPMRKLRDTVMEKYKKEGLNLLNSYAKNRLELAKFENTAHFLQRCDVLQVVPSKYRLMNNSIRNTRHVVRTLDRFSFQIMRVDLKYNLKRRFQVTKLLAEKVDRMKTLFDAELVEEIQKISTDGYERRFARTKEQQIRLFDLLAKEYNLGEQELEEGEERLKQLQQREKERDERRTAERDQRLKDRENEKLKEADKEADKDAEKGAEKDAEKGTEKGAEKTEAPPPSPEVDDAKASGDKADKKVSGDQADKKKEDGQ